MIIKYFLYIAIGYALLVLVVFVIQRSLLYYPDRSKPNSEYLAAMGLKFWPAPSQFKGVTGINAPDPANGTVIVFHGNAGSAWHRDYYVRALEPMGFRVILAEYPGYGGRPGKMSEKNFIDDAKGIIASVRTDFGNPVYLIGESMGCGVAAALAADASTAVSGLVLVTPWDSLPSLAQTHYWYLPARWLVIDQYDSVRNLQSFDRPVAVAMADHDEVIPNKHTLKLYNAISAPKQLWRFKNAGHNSWPTSPGERWWKEVMQFVTKSNQGILKGA